MATLTYSDIQTRVMNQLRLPTSNTAVATQVQALVNEVYRDVYGKQDWWWLQKRQVVNTSDDYATGTVNVTKGSTSVTLSVAPGAGLGSFAGRVFHVDGNTDDSGAIFRIATHSTASASVTLDAAYTGPDNTAAGYTIWHDTYDLATDVGKVIAIRRFGYTWPLDLVSPQEMHDLKIWDVSEGKPHVATVHDFDTTGGPTTVRQLIVHPYPDDTYRLEIHYKQALNTEVSGTTRLFIPDDYVQVIVYGTMALAYPVMLNDVERGTYFSQLFADRLTLMTLAQRERGADTPSLAPRDHYRGHFHGRRISPARVDLGQFFDRWPAAP
jgi:hypothetical protein